MVNIEDLRIPVVIRHCCSRMHNSESPAAFANAPIYRLSLENLKYDNYNFDRRDHAQPTRTPHGPTQSTIRYWTQSRTEMGAICSKPSNRRGGRTLASPSPGQPPTRRQTHTSPPTTTTTTTMTTTAAARGSSSANSRRAQRAAPRQPAQAPEARRSQAAAAAEERKKAVSSSS